MDLWDAEQAIAAAAHYRELAAPLDSTGDDMAGITKVLLSGDLAGGIIEGRKAVGRSGMPTWLPCLYYVIGDLQTADALLEVARRIRESRRVDPSRDLGIGIMGVDAYGHLAHGDVDEARRMAVASLTAPKRIWGGRDIDAIVVRLVVDSLIESGEAHQVVEFFEKLAPEYARYKATRDIDPKDFSPAPIPVKSPYASFPVPHFAEYIRALRAAGDDVGANQMLDHLDAILALRRDRGLFIEERHAAEALALRGRTDAALDALEKAERDRTIYHYWHLVLLHNEVFAGFRDHPRFVALVEKIRRDLSRQRDELSRMDLGEPQIEAADRSRSIHTHRGTATHHSVSRD
jgi:hypothetical protein